MAPGLDRPPSAQQMILNLPAGKVRTQGLAEYEEGEGRPPRPWGMWGIGSVGGAEAMDPREIVALTDTLEGQGGKAGEGDLVSGSGIEKIRPEETIGEGGAGEFQGTAYSFDFFSALEFRPESMVDGGRYGRGWVLVMRIRDPLSGPGTTMAAAPHLRLPWKRRPIPF